MSKKILLLLSILITVSAAKNRKVTLQLKWRHQFQFAGYYAAQELGFYDEEELDVAIRPLSPGMSVVDEVVSGRADFGVAMPDVLIDHAGGTPISIVAPIFQHSPFLLLSKKDSSNSQISSLRGKRIMIRPSGSNEIIAMLKQAGIDSVNTSFVPHSWNAKDLADGTVDAMVFYSSQIPGIINAYDSLEFQEYTPINYGIDFYGDCIITSHALAEADPELVRKFKRATSKGWIYALNSPHDVIDIIQNRYPSEWSREDLLSEAEVIRRLILPRYIDVGTSYNGRWRDIAATFQELNMLPEDYRFDSTVIFGNEFSVQLPNWVKDIILFLSLLLVLMFLFNRRLKKEVQKSLNQLRKNEGKFRTIFENSTQLMGILNNKGVLLAANPTALAMVDRKEEQVVGKPFWETPWWQHNMALQQKLRQSIIGACEGRTIQFETTHIDKEGKTRVIDFSLIPALNSSGSVDYIIAVGYDMTHIHEIEERDRQLQKMEAIGTLAGGIAHDFNNILAALFGYLDLAFLEEAGNERLHDALTEIKRASTRAKELVGQILTFSRKGNAEKKPLQLSLVIDEVMKLIRSSLPSTIVIDQKINSDDYILANATQIHQVVMNLCTNGFHAMQAQNSGLLSVELEVIIADAELLEKHAEMKPGEYLKLVISDTGSGMDSSVVKQVFNPYFTTKQSGKGTGLGLSLVHSIITSHEGVISIHSKPGIGTTFTILFPRLAYTPEKRVESAGSEQRVESSNISILFVDDEEMIVKSSTRYLEHAGFRVTSFTESSEALSAFTESPGNFSIVISDMTMPVLDGVDLLTAIKEIRSDIPVILCSGFNQKESELRENFPLINKCLQKPLELNERVKVVKDMVSHSQQ